MKIAKYVFLPILLASCTTADELPHGLRVTSDSRMLVGWLNARGDLALFGTSRFPSRYVYDRGEDEKCVSLINVESKNYENFHGKRVIVEGFSVQDDALVDRGPRAPIPARLVYEGVPVENWCMRNYMFVVREIRDAENPSTVIGE